MSKNQKWTKDCPKCGNTQSYSSKSNLKKASLANRICLSCANSGDNNPFFGKKHSDKTIEIIQYHSKNVSEETRKKMSTSHMGKVHSSETRVKLSESTKQYFKNMSKDEYKARFNDEFCKRRRLANIAHWESKHGVYPNYNPSSIPIIEEKARELGITDLQHAENGGEYHIKELGYWVDGYSKEKNIVIEYDEPHHKRQVEADQRRQKEITELLDCKFVRIVK